MSTRQDVVLYTGPVEEAMPPASCRVLVIEAREGLGVEQVCDWLIGADDNNEARGCNLECNIEWVGVGYRLSQLQDALDLGGARSAIVLTDERTESVMAAYAFLKLLDAQGLGAELLVVKASRAAALAIYHKVAAACQHFLGADLGFAGEISPIEWEVGIPGNVVQLVRRMRADISLGE